MTFFELVALAKAKGGSQLSMFHFKGAVNTINDLPETGEDGDVYLVDSEDSYFAWDGEGWTDVGNIFTIEDEEDLEKARTALQPEDLEPYRTASDQDVIDDAQNDRLDDLEQTTTAATVGPAPIADYLPCLDGNGVACMWDNIAGEYVYNDGTGDFAYGNTITPTPLDDVYYLKENGAWHVIEQ